MNRANYDMPVNFRANEALVLRAQKEANRRSVSLSELVRQAVRKEVRELEDVA